MNMTYLGKGLWILNDNFHLSYEVWNLLNDELMLCDNLGFKWANFVKYDFGLNFDYLDNKLVIM